MKLVNVGIFLYCFTISHNFAQQTYQNKQQNKDIGGEILGEMREISKTFGLYLDKMNSLGEQMKAFGEQMNSMEERMKYIEHRMGPDDEKCTIDIKESPCHCSELLKQNVNTSGVYRIKNDSTEVYCDMETDGGGWLVFQRRTDGIINFNRGWNDYKNGFGTITNEFWLGNEILYQILNACEAQHELRIDLEDHSNNTRYAKYLTFRITDQRDNYRLIVDGYSGDAGDSFSQNNGHQFTTFDKDNDIYPGNCAEQYKGAWWYSKTCGFSNLNGLYLNGPQEVGGIGVNWEAWKGFKYSLKFTEMKIRPL